MRTANLPFLHRIAPGLYEGVDPLGRRHRIVQRTSSAWEVYRDGEFDYEAGSLKDAKLGIQTDLRRARNAAPCA